MNARVRAMVSRLESRERRSERMVEKHTRRYQKMAKNFQRANRASLNAKDDEARINDVVMSAELKVENIKEEEAQWLGFMVEEQQELEDLRQKYEALERRRTNSYAYMDRKVEALARALCEALIEDSLRTCDLDVPQVSDELQRLEASTTTDEAQLEQLKKDLAQALKQEEKELRQEVFPYAEKKAILSDIRQQKKELVSELVKVKMELRSLESVRPAHF